LKKVAISDYLDILATASFDGKVRVWRIPDPFDKDLIDPLIYLPGHQKKVNLLQFNPVAEGILASASQDCSVKLWDLHRGEERISVDVSLTAF
jgi:coronin-1B/1C/6